MQSVKNKPILKVHDLNDINFLKAILQYGNDIVICLTKDFKIHTLNASAEKFYNLKQEKIAGEDFLQFCKFSNYTCPISANFFDNPTILNINLDSRNSLGKQCNINWIICPLVPTNKHINGVVIIGKDVEIKKITLLII